MGLTSVPIEEEQADNVTVPAVTPARARALRVRNCRRLSFKFSCCPVSRFIFQEPGFLMFRPQVICHGADLHTQFVRCAGTDSFPEAGIIGSTSTHVPLCELDSSAHNLLCTQAIGSAPDRLAPLLNGSQKLFPFQLPRVSSLKLYSVLYWATMIRVSEYRFYFGRPIVAVPPCNSTAPSVPKISSLKVLIHWVQLT